MKTAQLAALREVCLAPSSASRQLQCCELGRVERIHACTAAGAQACKDCGQPPHKAVEACCLVVDLGSSLHLLNVRKDCTPLRRPGGES